MFHLFRRSVSPVSRFFKSAAFPILLVVVLAFFARNLISPGDDKPDPPKPETRKN